MFTHHEKKTQDPEKFGLLGVKVSSGDSPPRRVLEQSTDEFEKAMARFDRHNPGASAGIPTSNLE